MDKGRGLGRTRYVIIFLQLTTLLMTTAGQARSSTIPLLQTKLPSLTNQLTAALLASLSLASNKKSTCVMITSLLVRLKAAAAARQALLEMRTNVVTGLTSRIGFEGDISSYVGDLSVVWFTGIKHTADWYLASFKDNESTSGMHASTSSWPLFLTR